MKANGRYSILCLCLYDTEESLKSTAWYILHASMPVSVRVSLRGIYLLVRETIWRATIWHTSMKYTPTALYAVVRISSMTSY